MEKKIITVWGWRQAIQKSAIPSTTKLVLFNLSCWMNEQGQGCYPSTARQAQETGLSERAVCEHLEKAVVAGFLIKRVHGFSGKGWARHDYVACYPNAMQLATQDVVQVTDAGSVPKCGGADAGSVRDEDGTDAGSVPENQGTDAGSAKALTQGQSISPVISPDYSVKANALTAAEAAMPAARIENQNLGVVGGDTDPPTPPPDPLQLKKNLWAVGKKYLTAAGIDTDRAGKMIGQWRKELGKALGEAVGDATLIHILAAAQAEAAADPIGFIEGCVANNLGKARKKIKLDAVDDAPVKTPIEQARVAWKLAQSKSGRDDLWNRRALKKIRDLIDQPLPDDLRTAEAALLGFLGSKAGVRA